MMETRVFDPNQAYRYYQERHTAEQRVKELEIQLIEANEAAQLQRALDRIEAGGYFWTLEYLAQTREHQCAIFSKSGWIECNKKANTAAEAAERAAAWAEGQKEG